MCFLGINGAEEAGLKRPRGESALSPWSPSVPAGRAFGSDTAQGSLRISSSVNDCSFWNLAIACWPSVIDWAANLCCLIIQNEASELNTRGSDFWHQTNRGKFGQCDASPRR